MYTSLIKQLLPVLLCLYVSINTLQALDYKKLTAKDFTGTTLPLAPVTDIFLDLCYGPHTPENIKAKLQVFKDIGFQRVYFVIANPGYPTYGMDMLDFAPTPKTFGNYAKASVDAVGDINKVMIETAHELGMEAWPVFKPYEGGDGRSLPHGKKHPVRERGLSCIGGTAYGFDTFILDNPEMRIQRRPEPHYEADCAQNVTRIELAFCTNPQSYKKHLGTLPPSAGHALTDIQLWTSNDNGTYTAYTGPVSIKQSSDTRIITDANGFPSLKGVAQPCHILTLDGFESPAPYFAVTFTNPQKRHVTVPWSMITAYGKGGLIPTTIGTRVRKDLVPLGTEWNDRKKHRFDTDGFEFEDHGWGVGYPGWHNLSSYGIAKGKNSHVKGTLCEAYPEVRAYWLATVQQLIAYGADGIDFRLVSHSCSVTDWANYGFNKPVMHIYKQKHGDELVESEEDYHDIMHIRGDFYSLFLRDAQQALHAANRKMQIHMSEIYTDHTHDGFIRGLVQWGNPKIFLNWKEMVDLADEITIKDKQRGRYKKKNCALIKQRAAAAGKPIWVHCYLTQGPGLQQAYFDSIATDPRISGVLIYETVKRHNPNSGMNRPGIVGIAPDGSLMRDDRVIDILQALKQKE